MGWGNLNAEQATKVIARTWHRRLQRPSLEQKVPRVLVGISDKMDLVVLGLIEDDGKILNRVPLCIPCLTGA